MVCPFSQVIFVFIYAKRRRQIHSFCLSWSYISDLPFLVVLDWRGKLNCEHQIMHEDIKCFAQKRFRRRHNVLILRTD